MKKLIMLLLFVSVSIFWMPTSYAQEVKPFDYPPNLLKLSNLMTPIDSYEIAHTIEPIAVESGQMYTLILSHAFLGNHVSYIDYEMLTVTSVPSLNEAVYSYINDNLKQTVYVEFIPTSATIHLSGIPASPDGYQASLVKGNYASFTGYLPYLYPHTNLETTGHLSMDVDVPMTIDQIKAYITARNPQGGILTYEIISDDYSTSQKLPGQYHISFMATYMDVYHVLNIQIDMHDLTAPVLSFEGTSVEVPLANKYSIDTLKALVTIVDNVDTLSSDQLVVIADTYSQASTVGNYSITFEIFDLSGNRSTLVMPITLVDLKAPDIQGPYNVYIYTEDTPLTHQDIYDYFNITDDVDGSNVMWSFTVDNYNQTQLPGKYLMTLEVRDQQLNTAYQDFYIHVVNNSAPYFELNELIVEVSAKTPLTEQELVTWFKNQLLSKGLETEKVIITFNEYNTQADKEGNYYVYLEYDVGEETYISRILVEVKEENTIPWTVLIVGANIVIGASGYLMVRRFKKT
ncbi:MAG: hypothetical protein ACNA7K_01650 [Acholeplasmataceae bacterium]